MCCQNLWECCGILLSEGAFSSKVRLGVLSVLEVSLRLEFFVVAVIFVVVAPAIALVRGSVGAIRVESGAGVV